MALSRNFESVTWQHTNLANLGPASEYLICPGADHSNWFASGMGTAGEFLVPILDLPNFSIDVLADDALEIDIEVGQNSAAMDVLCTLVCGAVTSHNTNYDLPAPYNQNGVLTVTNQYMRLRFRNPTAGFVGPFELIARVWR